MKKIVLLPAVLVMLAGTAMASPLCATNTGLDVYQTTYGGFSNACQIGDKLFWNFSYSATSTGVSAPGAAGIQVVTDPGDGVTNPGLIFSSGGIVAFPGTSMNITLTYSVATLSGYAEIEDYSLAIAGGHDITALGSGVITESFSNPVRSLTASEGPGAASKPSDHVAFVPFVSGTTVTTLIQLQSPAGTDIVTISAIQEHFSEQIPEPYQFPLIGSGLILFGLRRRHARK